MDANNDGEISFREFSSAVRADPIMMTALGISAGRLSLGDKSPGLLSFASMDHATPKTPGGGAFKLSAPLLPGEGGAGNQSDEAGKCCNCCVIL